MAHHCPGDGSSRPSLSLSPWHCRYVAEFKDYAMRCAIEVGSEHAQLDHLIGAGKK
jgi:hypothetical protein